MGAKLKLEALKCIEFASEGIAIPTSPIAPKRASGTILKKGTAVIMVLLQSEPSAEAPLKGQSTVPADCAKLVLNVANKTNERIEKILENEIFILELLLIYCFY